MEGNLCPIQSKDSWGQQGWTRWVCSSNFPGTAENQHQKTSKSQVKLVYETHNFQMCFWFSSFLMWTKQLQKRMVFDRAMAQRFSVFDCNNLLNIWSVPVFSIMHVWSILLNVIFEPRTSYGYMIYDIWYMIFDVWFVIFDVWYMIYDLCFMIFDIWYMICHVYNTYVRILYMVGSG